MEILLLVAIISVLIYHAYKNDKQLDEIQAKINRIYKDVIANDLP